MSQFFKTWKLSEITSLTLETEVHPSFDYSEIINSERFTREAETGRVTQYKLSGGALQFDLPLDFVNSSDASQIRTWWMNQTGLRFSTIFSDSTAKFVDCRIVNKTDPFNTYTKAQQKIDFDGRLNLISISDNNTNRGIQIKTREANYFILGTSDGILAINALA